MARLPVSRPVRVAASVVGVAGMVALAGCSASGAQTDTGASDAAQSGAAGGSDYADGTYTAEGSYQTPRSVEDITVTMTLADGKVSAVEVTGDPKEPESKQYQGQFINGISAEVVGKPIDDLKVSRVSGSSLTSGGFNQAVDAIKKEAAAG